MIQILTWIDSGKKFGIPVEECKEVNRGVLLTPVPHSGDYITGIVNLRGDTVTVIDLSRLLGYTTDESRPHNTIVRLKILAGGIAIRAEEVDDILEIEEERLENAIHHLSESEASYISKVALTPQGLLLIVNTHALQNINVR